MLLGLKILIVEDNEINRRVLSALLATLRCEITMAEDGQQAVEACAVRRFDLILMDLAMPVMDGLSATRMIRTMGAWGRSVPILAVTARSGLESRNECFAAGMNGFVTKPVDIAVLLSEMHQALRLMERSETA